MSDSNTVVEKKADVRQSSTAISAPAAATSTAADFLSVRPKTKSKSSGSSPKQTSREHSRQHSPSVDLKMRSRPGSPVAEVERAGEEAFSRDSAAGSGYSSPFSERATPPHLRWARSLEDVLDDYEGMELFKQYLAEIRESHLLDFWYACKGFKKLDATESYKIRTVAEQLWAEYVAPRGKHCLSCLTPDTRSAIRSCLMVAGAEMDQSMYDDAQNEVQSYLRNRHAQFAGSEMYILYIQDVQAGGWDSPKCYSHEVHSNSSSSGEARRPSTLLPTLHEDAEFESESERMAGGSVGPKCFTAAGTNSGNVMWSHNTPVDSKSFMAEPSVTAMASTTAPSGPLPLTGDDTPASQAGVKRRASSASGPGCNQQPRSAGLTSHALAATSVQRRLPIKPMLRLGGPPNPYHTPYVPHLPPSAQDSELQSMSSDATTDTGFSGANYQRKEQHQIMRYHLEHNRDLSKTVPRTSRSPPRPLTMMDFQFCRDVKEALEKVKWEEEKQEKIQESLQRLSEPENDQNDHRAAVNKFYREEKNRQTLDDEAEAILDSYCSRVPYLKDSPKQSPLRSPGFPGVGRRRSPIAKSPIRAMIASYPSAAQPPVATFSHPCAKAMVDGSALMSQSVVQPSRGKAGHHSAGNTMHRAQKHDQFSLAPTAFPAEMDKRAAAVPKKLAPRYPQAASDTSGISSGPSNETSLVCAPITSNLGQRGGEQYWVLDGASVQRVDSDGTRHKIRSGNTVPVASSTSDAKSHRSSGHRSGEKGTPADKPRGQKFATDSIPSTTQKLPSAHSRRSEPSSFPVESGAGPAQGLIVGIFLPNENTPYLVRFGGRQITLKQFKQLVPRKGNFRYFFQCVSDELGTGTVQREVVDDQEILPLCDNKVVAKIVVNE